MNLLKAIIAGSVMFGSALSYAGDGYDRSMKMNERFRADQIRIYGSKSSEQNAGELHAKNTQHQSSTEIKEAAKAE